MDDFSEAKKDILKCLGLVAEDVIDLTNSYTRQKSDLIVLDLYEIMRKLTAGADK